MRRLLILLPLLAACGDDDTPPARRSVLVVTIDTLRADAIGPGTGTPAFVEFLAESTWFVGARTVAPLTVPAHASLFTGVLPSRHGNHDNTEPLDREAHPVSLLAEEYAAAGYATAAFVSSGVMGPDAGLDPGFDVYAVPEREEDAHARVDETLAWLDTRPDGAPWFCWVHFWDPHTPYEPFQGDAKRAGTKPTDPPRAIYAGEVRRVDAALERLLAAAGPDPMVVLVSDHGEAFGEHEEVGHGPLCYGTTVDLFLAVRAPALERGVVDEKARSICDVAPSLRRWSGLPELPHDGTPLDEEPERLPVTVSLIAYRVHGWGQCFAVTDGRFSLVESGPRVELFDREADPGETTPLDLMAHPAYERLDRALAAYRRSGLSEPERVRDVVTPYGVGRRGYARYLPRPENAKLEDPRARGGLWALLERLRARTDQAARLRAPDAILAAIQTLEELVANDAGNPALRWHLAQHRRRMAETTDNRTWLRDAARAGREAIARGYDSAPVLAQVLEDAAGSGNREEMRAVLALLDERGLRAGPSVLQPAMRIGRMLKSYGDEEGYAMARRILERGRVDDEETLAGLRRLLG